MGLLQRRANQPGDRPARHRSCAPDQSDACLGGRALPDPPARRTGNPLVGRWSRCRWDRRGGRYTSRGAAAPQGDGRGSASPRHRLGEHPQQGPCAPRFGGAPTAL